MKIPLLSGIYASPQAQFRTSYPRNLVPVPKSTGISEGFLAPSEGLELFATGPGRDRGGYNWLGNLYRVMGTKLVSVSSAGAVTVLGDVGAGGTVVMDAGFDCMAIWSGGRLYYWDGSALVQVVDPDLGIVISGCWISGYFMSTDGTSLIVTELNDRTSVNPLKYGSAEADPDPVQGVAELRNEVYAMGRYTIEVFENVGGSGFPFQRIDGAQVPKGVIGTHAFAEYLNTFAFVGSGKNEAPAVYLMLPGDTRKLSTREIDEVLASYSERQLSTSIVEVRVHKGHQHLYIHLTDQTLVYDAAASQIVESPVWFTLDSGLGAKSAYLARGFVWCYDKWVAGNPASTTLCALTDENSHHYGEVIGWDFGTPLIYNESNGAAFHSLELIALPGRVPLGVNPTIWTSYSVDGETYSQERPISAGTQGNREQRLMWRRQGTMRNYRAQHFRGTSDCHLSVAALEAVLEPLRG